MEIFANYYASILDRYSISQKKIISFTYNEYLNQAKDETVIFLHPFPGSSKVFDIQIDIWQNSYNSLVFDLPGFGRSKPHKEFSIDHYVTLVHSLVEKYAINPKKLVMYGMSFGGIIAIEYAKRYRASKFILESVPFSTEMLITDEFAVEEKFKWLLEKTHTKEKLQGMLRKSIFVQGVLLTLYKLVRPKVKTPPKDEDILYYMRHLDFDTFFFVTDYLQDFSIMDDVNSIKDNAIFVFDKYDPTVSYAYLHKNLKGIKYIYLTEYYTHAPSYAFGREMAPKIIQYLSNM